MGTEYDPCHERALDGWGNSVSLRGNDAQGPAQDDLSGSGASRLCILTLSLRGSFTNKELRSKHFLLFYLGPVKSRTPTKKTFSLLSNLGKGLRWGAPYPRQPVYQLPNRTHPQQNAMKNKVVTHDSASARIMPGAPRYHTGSSRSLRPGRLLLLSPEALLILPSPP